MRIAPLIFGFLLPAALSKSQAQEPLRNSAATPVLDIPSSSILPPLARVITGAAQLNQYLPLPKGQSVAVFANQASKIGNTHLVDTLLKRGIHIRKIFTPEHGFRGTADAGENLGNLRDAATGIPIISLYGNKLGAFRRRPGGRGTSFFSTYRTWASASIPISLHSRNSSSRR